MNKTELRKKLKSVRENMHGSEVLKKSSRMCGILAQSDIFRRAEVVMVYLSFGSEADTAGIIKKAFDEGKKILVPLTFGEDIIPCVLENTAELVPGAFGIMEPKIKNEWTGKIDICIVPGLGFERNGGRIGFGKGYYDRFLLKTDCVKIGFAFSNQIVEDVLADSLDIPMDMIVTEEEMFCCG